MRGGLCPRFRRIHGVRLAVDNEVVEAVFHVRSRIGNVEQPLGVRVVFREKQVRCAVAIEITLTKFGMGSGDHRH